MEFDLFIEAHRMEFQGKTEYDDSKIVFSIYPQIAMYWGLLETDWLVVSIHEFIIIHKHSPVWMMSFNNIDLH